MDRSSTAVSTAVLRVQIWTKRGHTLLTPAAVSPLRFNPEAARTYRLYSTDAGFSRFY